MELLAEASQAVTKIKSLIEQLKDNKALTAHLEMHVQAGAGAMRCDVM